MTHRIQIMVDDDLDHAIKAGAKKLGLSVSAYARLALMNGLTQKQGGLLDQAMADLESNRVETTTLKDFNNKIDK